MDEYAAAIKSALTDYMTGILQKAVAEGIITESQRSQVIFLAANDN